MTIPVLHRSARGDDLLIALPAVDELGISGDVLPGVANSALD